MIEAERRWQSFEITLLDEFEQSLKKRGLRVRFREFRKENQRRTCTTSTSLAQIRATPSMAEPSLVRIATIRGSLRT